MRAKLLELLRSFASFKDQPGYTLKSGRYHLDGHHALHLPSRFPPRLHQESQFPQGEAQEGSNGAYASELGGHGFFVKNDSPEGGDARNELSAYTVLGSLGFRVPHTSVVQTEDGTPATASKSLHTAGHVMRPHFLLSPTERYGTPSSQELDYTEHGDTLSWRHDPRDRMDQRLAPALALDQDRNSGNILHDPQGRRWDIDFGTGEASRWLEGMDVFDAEELRNRLHTVLEAHKDKKEPLLRSIRELSDPHAERHFDWLRDADHAPYKHLGFPNPHGTLISSLRVVRPDLHALLDQHR